jgi:hypothetical protein
MLVKSYIESCLKARGALSKGSSLAVVLIVISYAFIGFCDATGKL